MINSTLGDLLGRMRRWEDGTPVQMNRVYRAATKDVIQAYAFGDGGEKCLEMEDCNAAFFDIMTPQRVCHAGTHVYWLAYIMANLPPWIMLVLLPRVGVFAAFMEVWRLPQQGSLCC